MTRLPSYTPRERSLRQFVLPDGSAIVHDPASLDTDYVCKEIFESRVYLRHGVALHDDASILDVGGHIGMFSLYALKTYARIKSCVLEPMPRSFAALTCNLAPHARAGSDVRMLNCGASDREQTADFTYYPRIPGHSTLYPENKAEVHRTVEQDLYDNTWSYNRALAVVCFLLFPMRRFFVRLAARWFFESIRVPCQLRPLSDIIDEQAIDRVDLLKIDVEDAELAVLAGIRPEHWARIRQVVVETNNLGERCAKVVQLLTERGFRCVAERDHAARSLGGLLVFAVREVDGAELDDAEDGKTAPAATQASSAASALGLSRTAVAALARGAS